MGPPQPTANNLSEEAAAQPVSEEAAAQPVSEEAATQPVSVEDNVTHNDVNEALEAEIADIDVHSDSSGGYQIVTPAETKSQDTKHVMDQAAERMQYRLDELESSLDNTEIRELQEQLRPTKNDASDIADLHAHYASKITDAAAHHALQTKNLQDEHAQVIKDLKAMHLKSVGSLDKQHANTHNELSVQLKKVKADLNHATLRSAHSESKMKRILDTIHIHAGKPTPTTTRLQQRDAARARNNL